MSNNWADTFVAISEMGRAKAHLYFIHSFNGLDAHLPKLLKIARIHANLI